MWFEHAYGKEKIKFMFDNELSLNGAECESILFYDLSKLRINFRTKHVPKKIPAKWDSQEFNALSVTLTLIGIDKLSLEGERIGFECTPVIEKLSDRILFRVSNGDAFYLSCAAEVIVIDSVEPYLDQRWN